MRDSTEASDAGVNKEITDYISGLSDEHRMLVILKTQLYGGTWEPMVDDLFHRLMEPPRIRKLEVRINEDVKRIEEMQKFEVEHNIDLADYIDLDNEPYLQASANKIKPKYELVNIQKSVQKQKLLLHIYTSEIAEDDDVVNGFVSLYRALSKYHVLCGGRGLAIDDWQMFIHESNLVEVR